MDHKSPLLAADVIIHYPGDNIVLIERKYEPYGWALPGGHVDVGETVEDAARREMKEETNLDVDLIRMVGVYSDPKRDPRRHVVSVAFVAVADGMPVAGDDAANAQLFNVHNLPFELAFDHFEIIEDWLSSRPEEGNP